MSQEFNIKTYQPDSIGELARFLGAEYPSGEIAVEDFLKWEYLDNPFGKAIVTTAREGSGQIVSQYALLPVQIYRKGEISTGTLSLNTLTSKKYRGQGLFKKTASETFNHCSENELAFTFGIPNKNSFPGFVKDLKFTHAGNLVLMAKPLKPLRILLSMMNRKQKKGSAIPLQFDESVLAKNDVSDFIFPRDQEKFNLFMDAWNAQGAISVFRSPAFLQWRYMQTPLRKYKMLKLVEGGGIKALAIVRTMQLYGIRVCLLMDHISLDKKYSRKLLKAISDEAKRNSIEMMIAVAAHKQTLQYEHLIHSGFWSVPKYLLPQQLPFILRIHNHPEKMSPLKNLKSWHFSLGDYDVF